MFCVNLEKTFMRYLLLYLEIRVSDVLKIHTFILVPYVQLEKCKRWPLFGDFRYSRYNGRGLQKSLDAEVRGAAVWGSIFLFILRSIDVSDYGLKLFRCMGFYGYGLWYLLRSCGCCKTAYVCEGARKRQTADSCVTPTCQAPNYSGIKIAFAI